MRTVFTLAAGLLWTGVALAAGPAQRAPDGTFTIELDDADAPAGHEPGSAPAHGAPKKAKPAAGQHQDERHAEPRHEAPAQVEHETHETHEKKTPHGKPEPHDTHAPAKEAHAPAHGKHAPAKEAHAPAHDEHAPAHDEHAPAKEAHAPAHDEHAPAHGEAPAPAHGETHELLDDGHGEPKPKPKRKPRPRDWRPLSGTGAEGARHNKWGVVEAVPPAVAARVRLAYRGDEIEFPERVHFRHDSIRFETGADDVLRRIAESLQSSPEIQKLWIEGHTDISGSESYNQKLSEARASAVREALVKLGVAPERLVAYGFGETRPLVVAKNPKKTTENRRVVFRLVSGDRPALQARRVSEFGLAAVVGTWGQVRWRSAPGDDAAGWAPLAFRTQLPEGALIDTGENGRALVRLPDLSRVVLEPGTRLTLTKLFHNRLDNKSYTGVRLEAGFAQVEANPDERGVSTAIWSWDGGAVEVTSADFELRVTAEGAGLSVLRGGVKVSNGGDHSLEVLAGDRLAPGATATAPLLSGPAIVGPLQGSVASAALSWQGVEGAARYRVDVAEDVTFYQVAQTAEVPETAFTAPGLDPTRTWYWRVRPVSGDGIAGLSSRIHAFRLGGEGEAPAPAPTATPASTAAH